MKAYPMMPGVPFAGHVTRSGFWHPGSISTCRKSPCDLRSWCRWCGNYHPTVNHQQCRENHERGLAADGTPLED